MKAINSLNSSKKRRRRGVILTAEGLERLQEAKSEAEFIENGGNRYTLEALSERTSLAVDTLMKVFACEAGVDKQTLKCCFKSFNLVLESKDFYRPNPEPSDIETAADGESIKELPEGQVPLDSPFYIERSPIESDCYKAILQDGALIRIKAPRRMGKTSLLSRILHLASQQGCWTVPLSFHLADKELFQELDKFLQWFCANVSLNIELPNRVKEYWEDLFGSKISSKIYFEQYILDRIDRPLVIGLDDVDRLFQYPDLADDFFGLLRAWHEEAKNREIWKKLRLIVVHSTEVYIPLNVNQSPFNVGLPIELPQLTFDQVRDLVERYDLDWSEDSIEQLMELVSGHPYLIRLALYHVWHQNVTLEQLLANSPTAISTVYGEHLQRQLWNLQQKNGELSKALAKVVVGSKPIELDLVQGFKLQSFGLVRSIGNQSVPSCRLYAQFFRSYFSGLS